MNNEPDYFQEHQQDEGVDMVAQEEKKKKEKTQDKYFEENEDQVFDSDE